MRPYWAALLMIVASDSNVLAALMPTTTVFLSGSGTPMTDGFDINKEVKLRCYDPIDAALESRARMFHFDQALILTTKECANAATEVKIAGIKLPFKGLSEWTPDVKGRLEACFDRHRELDPEMRTLARDVIKDVITRRDHATDQVRMAWSACIINLMNCHDHRPCTKVAQQHRRRKVCEIDAEAGAKPWKRPASCATYASRVATDAEAEDYRTAKALGGCTSFVVNRCL